MPIYEFKCKKCDHKFEQLRLSSAGFKDVACPKCGGKQVTKEMSSFAASVPASSAPPCGGSPKGGCGGGMCGMN
ncbi:MAG: zinc ribbon domain-containing protein [Nitrospinae bacterium]|nr:zinc ribbon domain-containing protein [Nitrospinota bacterium]